MLLGWDNKRAKNNHYIQTEQKINLKAETDRSELDWGHLD